MISDLDSLRDGAIAPLESAKCLPFSAYTSEEVYAAEQSKIFRQDWVFVCTAHECPSPGDYVATRIGGEPVVVLRGSDHTLRAFSNVCRHRGTPLLDEGTGSVDRNIVCPYHAWSYDLSGTLRSVPFNKHIPVEPAEHSLVALQLETWLGLVFLNLGHSSNPLAERVAGIEPYLRAFEPERFDLCAPGNSETWNTNWKLAIENGIESYHLFKVHGETLERTTPTRGAYYVAGSSEWSLTGGKSNKEDGLVASLLGSNEDLFRHYMLISLPPSFIGIMSYGSLSWLSAHPVDRQTTQVRSGAIGLPGYLGDDQPTTEFTQAFLAEDKQICERVQSGMTAQIGRGGKLVDMERVVVDFHQYLATRLFDLPATPLFENEEAKRHWASV